MGLKELRDGSVQYRSAVLEDVDTAKGEMLMKAVPYSSPTDIGGGIVEEFLPATFARAAKSPSHLRLWRGHYGRAVGHGLEVDDRPEGLWLRMRLGRSQDARDTLLDYEDGIAADPSVEFYPHPSLRIIETPSGIRVTHKRATLTGVALETQGAYHGKAYVESIRNSDIDRDREAARLWVASLRPELR